MRLKNRFPLEAAIGLSPTRAAFRVAPMRDMWGVHVESGEYPYTLIHRYTMPGYPNDVPQRDEWQFRTLDELQANEQILNVWLSDHDWCPDSSEETKKMFPTLTSVIDW